MGTFDSMSGPSRLIGEEWVEHGYRTSPTTLVPDECPICGSPNNTCTALTHAIGMEMQRQEDD